MKVSIHTPTWGVNGKVYPEDGEVPRLMNREDGYKVVYEDGTEVIGNELHRAKDKKGYIEYNGIFMRPLDDIRAKKYFDIWADVINTKEYDYNAVIELPKGTIKKLINKELTWEDEPVEVFLNLKQ